MPYTYSEGYVPLHTQNEIRRLYRLWVGGKVIVTLLLASILKSDFKRMSATINRLSENVGEVNKKIPYYVQKWRDVIGVNPNQKECL